MSGPTPKYQPTFTTEQIEEAHHLAACHQAPHVQVQRAKMVLMLADHPDISNPELGHQIDAHPNTVFKWRKDWTVHGFHLDDHSRSGRPPIFSPTQITAIKAIACELPYQLKLPFSRLSLSELQDYLIKQQVVEHISIGKLWTILDEDAIRPWYHRSWLFPRDPQFLVKASPILDLYQGTFEERALRAREYVLSFDQKTSIQARARRHPSVPPHSGHPQLVEHEYERQGALHLLACLDVHSGRVWGRCYARKRRAETEAFVNELFSCEPYASAKRIHFILDNGTSQHPNTFPTWVAQNHPKVMLHYLPTHASWLNQIELYFSILQRKVLTPNDFRDLESLEQRLMEFQAFYNRTARPFNWKFTRADLEERLRMLC